MKEHTDATLTALIEAMHRNEPDTFIELVNNCHDLFGHDAAGHSLMWHARQSSNPVFAETLELLAAGKPFTEVEPSATDASDNKETTLDNQADEEKSILPDNNKLDEKPESAASAESPTATSDSTAGDIKAIPVEKLGWAAAAVGLALLVSAYFLFLVFHFEIRRADGTVLVFFACILNIMMVVGALLELFRSSTPPNRGISCDFVPCLFASFVLGVGPIYPEITEQGNAAFIWGPFGVLLLLSLAHAAYCERKNVDRWGHLLMFSLALGVLAILGIAFLKSATYENNGDFTSVVAFIAFYVIGIIYWIWWVEPAGDVESEGGPRALLLSIVLFFYGLAAAVIPHVWYGTIYTVAEFATYHDMPSVVSTCLPASARLSMFQEMHIGPERRQWTKDALRYAVQQGDARSAEAYLRILENYEKEDRMDSLAKEFNLRPLKEVWPWVDRWDTERQKNELRPLVLNYFGDDGLEKQISFDEPEMLGLLMVKETEDSCIKAIMKHNAQKDALWLIHSNGSNATYGEDRENRTLLQVAMEYNNLEMIELLLKHGADPDFAKSGKTPRQMAEEKKWGYALKLFKENGVKSSASGASTEPDYGKLLLGE